MWTHSSIDCDDAGSASEQELFATTEEELPITSLLDTGALLDDGTPIEELLATFCKSPKSTGALELSSPQAARPQTAITDKRPNFFKSTFI
jgi:hypothetical protein